MSAERVEVIRLRLIEPHLVPGAVWPPTSHQAEVDWLPVVGPTAWALARRVTMLAAEGEVTVALTDLAAMVGVMVGVARKALTRLAHFDLAAWVAHDLFVLASMWPPPRRLTNSNS